jgi:anti-anti-sigma factor
MNINTRQIEDVVVFDIEGEIRQPPVDTPTTLHRLVKSQLDQGARKILLNFRDVKYIDSFGVGELVASHISTQSLGGELKLTGVSGRIELLLKITSLWRFFNPQPSEEDALKSFADP